MVRTGECFDLPEQKGGGPLQEETEEGAVCLVNASVSCFVSKTWSSVLLSLW